MYAHESWITTTDGTAMQPARKGSGHAPAAQNKKPAERATESTFVFDCPPTDIAGTNAKIVEAICFLMNEPHNNSILVTEIKRSAPAGVLDESDVTLLASVNTYDQTKKAWGTPIADDGRKKPYWDQRGSGPLFDVTPYNIKTGSVLMKAIEKCGSLIVGGMGCFFSDRPTGNGFVAVVREPSSVSVFLNIASRPIDQTYGVVWKDTIFVTPKKSK